MENVNNIKIANSAAGPVLKPSLTSLASLEPYVGKVVKYTKDQGKTWNYVFLEKSLYEVQGQRIVPTAINGFTASDGSFWVGRRISAKIIIDEDMFDACLVGGSQIYFETAGFDEFKKLNFAKYGKLDSRYASDNSNAVEPSPVGPGPVKMMAPFTLVRSEHDDVDLKVSLAFDKAFELTQPTFPLPKEEKSRDIKSYSWDVHVNNDKTLDVCGSGPVEKVNLIWWEANRINRAKQFNMQDAVCMATQDIGAFIHEVLEKKGLSADERKAFVQYWQGIFAKHEKLPYVQVCLVEEAEHATLLPPMSIESKQAFDVKRFYFQFLPVETKGIGPSKAQFLKNMASQQLGKNVVLDLGGEVLPSKNGAFPGDDTAFNDQFIKDHIKV